MASSGYIWFIRGAFLWNQTRVPFFCKNNLFFKQEVEQITCSSSDPKSTRSVPVYDQTKVSHVQSPEPAPTSLQVPEAAYSELQNVSDQENDPGDALRNSGRTVCSSHRVQPKCRPWQGERDVKPFLSSAAPVIQLLRSSQRHLSAVQRDDWKYCAAAAVWGLIVCRWQMIYFPHSLSHL